jgi:hypothetical protein
MLSQDLRSVLRDLLDGRVGELTYHLSNCTFPTVERQGAVHKLDTHICVPAQSPTWTLKNAVSATHFHRPNTILILLIHNIFFNVSLWTAYSFLPHQFSIHVNQTRSHVNGRQHVLPKRRIKAYKPKRRASDNQQLPWQLEKFLDVLVPGSDMAFTWVRFASFTETVAVEV